MNTGFTASVGSEHEALVNLAYLQQLKIPALWRGRVELVPGAAHAIHRETPEAFTGLLTQFIAECRAMDLFGQYWHQARRGRDSASGPSASAGLEG